MLARSGQWWNIGQLREGDRLAESLEAQSGRTETSTERDSSGWERREQIQVNVDEETLSFANSEAFLTCRCLGVHHWRNLAGLATAYPRENSVAFNWTGNCVTCDRGVAEDSAHDGPDRRVHGQRSTRRGERQRAVPIDRCRTGRCRRGAGLHGCAPRRS